MDSKWNLAEAVNKMLRTSRTPSAWGTLGTIKPNQSFNAERDIDDLMEALKTKDIDEIRIVDILTNRSNEQRQQILKTFRSFTNQDLVKLLSTALSGNLEKLILGLMKTPAQFDAHEVKAALKGLGTNEDVLNEILITRSNKQLEDMATVYKQEFNNDLEKDIGADTTGDYKELLLMLAKGKREEYKEVINYMLIDEDAQEMHEAITNNKKPDLKKWIAILTEYSLDHLQRVFDRYKHYSSIDIEDAINKHMNGDAQKAMLALVSNIRNTPLYFADKLHNALKSKGTDDKTLIRILISRCENDLLSIRNEFRKKYGKSLYSTIQNETKGSYQAALLALCRAEDL
ncbi:annexin A9 [Protopterus annectens]|uniref:annexin A9 n=1 Tax=Protopterus annectens TaxID=7888 RepID=UPI001CFABF9E|nr:annexin A9 [Protopterus annectens]